MRQHSEPPARRRTSPRRRQRLESLPHRPTLRILDVLEAFGGGDAPGFSLAEMKKRLRIPKSSLLLILRALQSRHYLERDDDGHYCLAHQAFETSRQLLASAGPRGDLVELAHPFLDELARASGETVFLAVPTPSRSELATIDGIESRELIRYSATLGERQPLHCAAAGKAYLAFLPDARREQYLRSGPLLQMTPRTVTNPKRLRTLFAEIRQRRVAVAVDETTLGVSSIAAPILDRLGAAVAACTAVGPTDRIIARRDRIESSVREAGVKISERLGFHSPR